MSASPQSPTANLEAILPAPLSGWRRLAADLAAVGGSTLVCQGLAVVTSLVLRGALSPSQMGVWQGLKLLLGYANYANLGVSKGAARELAIAAGSGQEQQAERSLNLAFTVNTITSIVYGCGLAAAGLWLGRDHVSDSPWFLGLLAVAVLVVLQRHLTFHITILRCRQQFGLTAWASLVEGALTLTAAGLGAWQWGLPGLYGGTLLTMAGTLAFLHRQRVRPFRFGWQWDEIKRLVAIGGPILLGGVALSLFQSLDKLMLLGFSPDREFELGCYSTTLLITAQIYGLANMFAMVVAPRYAELFGRTGSPRAAAGLAARASEPLAAVTSAAAALGLLVAVPLLSQLFPAYRPGLLPALWLVPGVVFLSLTLPLNQYLVAVCRERLSLLASLAALATAAIADAVALRLGYGMMGVAAATAAVYAGYYSLMLGLSIWPCIERSMRLRYLWTQATLLAPAALAVCLADVRADSLNRTRLAVSLLIVLSAWCLAVLVVWRRGAWNAVWRREDCEMQNAKCKMQNDASEWWLGQKLAEIGQDLAKSCYRPAVPRWLRDRGIAAATHAGPTTGRARLCPSHRRRLTLAELDARCQKPNHRLVGNWMARRVARPLALRITWVVAPTAISAHAVTCLAMLTALSAAACFATGSIVLGLAGALLLQVWYLLDHVDGQVARLRQTASLDGVQLDYLMHHIVNLTIPCSLGYGLWKNSGGEIWLLLGFTYAVGLLLLALANDTRSKAFFDRLQGISLYVRPGKFDRLDPPAEPPKQRLLRRGVHIARKLCEIHVIMNTITALAVAQYIAGVPWLLQCYVALMAPLALITALATLARDIEGGAAEREFSRWFAADIDDRREPDDRANQTTVQEAAQLDEVAIKRSLLRRAKHHANAAPIQQAAGVFPPRTPGKPQAPR